MKNISTLLLKCDNFKTIIRATSVALFSLLAILTSAVKAASIAIIDTGFCYTDPSPAHVTLHPEFFAASLAPDYCQKADIPRLHGQKVLKELLSHLTKNSKSKIEVYPIVVYDQQGYASIESFAHALEKVKELKVDYLLLSVALPLEKDINPLPALPVTTYVAAGRAERMITKQTILWPHHFDDPKMILVGGLNQGRIDPKALYPAKTKVFMEGSSSLANARALAKALF